MTLYEFKILDEKEQIDSFWCGVLVREINEGEFTIECRQIDDLYVEYNKKGKHCVDMRSFRNPDLLKPYFEQMNDLDL
jgi:hypothetical protein